MPASCRWAGTARRPVTEERGGRPGDEVSFADECPLLLTSEASLADLNRRAPEPVAMHRFRPNLVVKDASAPYDEDHWRRVRIGGIEFDCAQACRRCVFTTIDPESGERHARQEPPAHPFHLPADGRGRAGLRRPPDSSCRRERRDRSRGGDPRARLKGGRSAGGAAAPRRASKRNGAGPIRAGSLPEEAPCPAPPLSSPVRPRRTGASLSREGAPASGAGPPRASPRAGPPRSE